MGKKSALVPVLQERGAEVKWEMGIFMLVLAVSKSSGEIEKKLQLKRSGRG